MRRATQLAALGLDAVVVPPASLPPVAGRGDVLLVFLESGSTALLAEAAGKDLATIVFTDEAPAERPGCQVLLEVRSASDDVTDRAHEALLPVLAERVSAEDVGDRPSGRRSTIGVAHA
jgi:hypothetical protein